MYLQVKQRNDIGQMILYVPKKSGLKAGDWVKIEKAEPNIEPLYLTPVSGN